MDVHPSQVEREKALSEMVLRFREPEKTEGSSKAKKRNDQLSASKASALLRQEILNWFKIGPSENPEEDPLRQPLADFQTLLEKLIHPLPKETMLTQDPMEPKRNGRPPGAKHAFRHIWQKLGLGLDEKVIHDEGALFFYLTLYTLCKNTIGAYWHRLQENNQT